jgi:hypothetical protein
MTPSIAYPLRCVSFFSLRLHPPRVCLLGHSNALTLYFYNTDSHLNNQYCLESFLLLDCLFCSCWDVSLRLFHSHNTPSWQHIMRQRETISWRQPNSTHAPLLHLNQTLSDTTPLLNANTRHLSETSHVSSSDPQLFVGIKWNRFNNVILNMKFVPTCILFSNVATSGSDTGNNRAFQSRTLSLIYVIQFWINSPTLTHCHKITFSKPVLTFVPQWPIRFRPTFFP